MSHHPEKTKAVARCGTCENILPVRVSPDGAIDPIGLPDCCDDGEYEVLEG
jgi:hypothetical protein